MKRGKRIYYTDIQKALMWDRWQQGESLQLAPRYRRQAWAAGTLPCPPLDVLRSPSGR